MKEWILTREPGEEICFIHDWMPVILPEERIEEWIRPDGNPEKLLVQALTEMVYEEAEWQQQHERNRNQNV